MKVSPGVGCYYLSPLNYSAGDFGNNFCLSIPTQPIPIIPELYSVLIWWHMWGESRRGLAGTLGFVGSMGCNASSVVQCCVTRPVVPCRLLIRDFAVKSASCYRENVFVSWGYFLAYVLLLWLLVYWASPEAVRTYLPQSLKISFGHFVKEILSCLTLNLTCSSCNNSSQHRGK